MKKRVNPRSLKNLRPWRKGHSGNPGGRPKNLVSDASRDWLRIVDPKTGKTNAELVAKALAYQRFKEEVGFIPLLIEEQGIAEDGALRFGNCTDPVGMVRAPPH